MSLGEVPIRGKTTIQDYRFPPGALGFSFWWAWIYLALLSPALSQPLSPYRSIDYLSLSFYTVLSGIVLFAVAIPLVNRHPSLSGNRTLIVISAVVTTLATLCVASAGDFRSYGQAVFIVGSIISGIGISMIYLLWSSYYSDLKPECVSSATLVSFLCALLIARLTLDHGLLTLLITAALPLLSMVLLLSRPHDDGNVCDAFLKSSVLPAGSSMRPRLLSWKIVGLVVVFCLTFGLFRALLSPTGAEVSTRSVLLILGSSAILGCTLLVVVSFFTHSLGWEFTLYLALPLIALAALALSIFGFDNHVFVWAIIVAAVRCSDLIMWNIFANMSRRSSKPAPVIFAYGKMAGQIGVLLGLIIGDYLLSLGNVTSLLLPIALFLIIILIVFASLASTDRGLQAERYARMADPTPVSGNEAAIGMIAHESALSVRETEVFLFLAKGRTIPYIADELTIAKSTVTTHARSIYKKIGVHNRQELIDYVEHHEGKPDIRE